MWIGLQGNVYRPNVVRIGSEEAPVSDRAKDVWVDGLIARYMDMDTLTWEHRCAYLPATRILMLCLLMTLPVARHLETQVPLLVGSCPECLKYGSLFTLCSSVPLWFTTWVHGCT